MLEIAIYIYTRYMGFLIHFCIANIIYGITFVNRCDCATSKMATGNSRRPAAKPDRHAQWVILMKRHLLSILLNVSIWLIVDPVHFLPIELFDAEVDQLVDFRMIVFYCAHIHYKNVYPYSLINVYFCNWFLPSARYLWF